MDHNASARPSEHAGGTRADHSVSLLIMMM